MALEMISIVIGLLLFIGAIVYTLKKAQPKWDTHDNAQTLSTTLPSPNFPAALAARLIRLDKITTLQLMMATLMDFARRDMLSFQPRSQRSVFGTTSNDSVVSFQDRGGMLHPFESFMVDMLFKNGADEISLNELGKHTTKHAKLLLQTIDEILEGMGLISIERMKQRKQLHSLSYALFLLIFILMLVLLSINNLTAFVYFIPTGLLCAALVILWGSYATQVRTEKGDVEAKRWQSFANYLKGIPNQEAAALTFLTESFNNYLPYAIAFDLGMQWIGYFILQKRISKPSWFPGVESGGGLFSFFTQHKE